MVRWSASITKADWKTHSSYRFSHEPSCMVRFTSPNPAPWISPSGIANGGNWATNGGSTPRDRSPSYGSSLNRRDRDRKVRPLVGTVYPYRLMWSIIFCLVGSLFRKFPKRHATLGLVGFFFSSFQLALFSSHRPITRVPLKSGDLSDSQESQLTYRSRSLGLFSEFSDGNMELF